MARRVPNQAKENNAHYKRIERYALMLDAVYQKATDEAVNLALLANQIGNTPFKWSDYPQTKAKLDQITRSFANDVRGVVVNGASAEWTQSNEKNDRLARAMLGVKKGEPVAKRFDRYFNHNDKALAQFIARKDKGGLDLSKRVWNLTEQFKSDLELSLSDGLSSGKSAAELSRDVRKHLNEPSKLFRRIRDDKGNLQLSNPAKAYHPGAGVYRSSYKNAQRLTRTEVNMAYRNADRERWTKMDFVVGFEVKRSGRGYDCSVCESLAGKYPKDFKFVGWHPSCYSDDSEVLTNRGWQLFKDVRADDLILSLNPETRNTEWVGIALSFGRPYSGDMVRFSNKALDCLVTPEHIMVYLNKGDGRIKECQAKDYSKGKGAFYRSSEWTASDADTISIGGETFDFDTFCEFMGYWLSDGSLIRKYQVKIAQKDGDSNKQNIIECVKKLGINVGSTSGSVDCYSQELNAYLRQFGKCTDKFVPSEIKNASKRQINLFLNAFISCDGYTRKPKSFTGNRGSVFNSTTPERMYFTTSKQLSSDIGEMLVKIGKRPSYRVAKTAGTKQLFSNGEYKINHDGIIISECKSQTATVFDKEIVSYHGMVYDLTLEKNHIMYIRRNGKCFWGSNCRCYVIPILKTDEEFWAWDGRGEAPTSSVNEVKDVPSGFKDWASKNQSRIANAEKNGTMPYFLRDNAKLIDLKQGATKATAISGAKAIPTPAAPTIQQRADKRHAARTAKQVEDIQSRWRSRHASVIMGEQSIDTIDKVQEVINRFLALYPDETNGKTISIGIYKDKTIRGGFSIMRANSPKGVIEFNNVCYPQMKDSPYTRLKTALDKIRQNKSLSFDEEYSVESLYHEMLHCKAKEWGRLLPHGKGDYKRTAMETVNQFVSRHEYPKFIERLGGKAVNHAEVLERGIGYSDWVGNFRGYLNVAKIDEGKAFEYFKERLLNHSYGSLDKVLAEYIRDNAGGALSAYSNNDILECIETGGGKWEFLINLIRLR